MAQVYIVTGNKMSGKTSSCLKFAQGLTAQSYSVGGFIAPGKIAEGKRTQIFLQNLKSGETVQFAQREAREAWVQIESFYFNPKAIKTGENWLYEHQSQSDFLFIDEVGRFDIQGLIWFRILVELLRSSNKIVLCIRDVFIKDVVDHFQIKPFKIVSSLEDFL